MPLPFPFHLFYGRLLFCRVDQIQRRLELFWFCYFYSFFSSIPFELNIFSVYIVCCCHRCRSICGTFDSLSIAVSSTQSFYFRLWSRLSSHVLFRQLLHCVFLWLIAGAHSNSMTRNGWISDELRANCDLKNSLGTMIFRNKFGIAHCRKTLECASHDNSCEDFDCTVGDMASIESKSNQNGILLNMEFVQCDCHRTRKQC